MLSYYKKIVKYLPSSLRKKLPKEIAVVTMKEAESRRLNRIYRKKDKSTNVLSFRYDDTYAEILICPSVIRREAKKQGNTFDYQMTWMVVHGMLHIAGIHHEHSLAAVKRVEDFEKKFSQTLALKFKNENSKFKMKVSLPR